MKKEKVKKIAKKIQDRKYRLGNDEIEDILVVANAYSRWSVDKIFKEALRLHIRSVLSVELTPKLKDALFKAADKSKVGIQDIAYYALKEWLSARKFL